MTCTFIEGVCFYLGALRGKPSLSEFFTPTHQHSLGVCVVILVGSRWQIGALASSSWRRGDSNALEG